MKIGAKIGLDRPHLVSALAKEYDFIEVYYMHNAPLQIEQWPKHIKWVVHTPHHDHGVNLSLEKNNNIEHVKRSLEFAQAIGAKKAIIHPGVGGSKAVLVKNLQEIISFADKLGIKMLLETVPKIYDNTKDHTISTPEEYKEIIQKIGIGFCLDFSHATHAAFSQKKDYKEYILEFMELKPKYFHLYDTIVKQPNDAHLEFGAGDFDLNFALSLIKNKMVTFELPEENQLEHYLNAKKYLIERGYYK
jgi:sugar phosphate isomerase/epimerase